MTKINFLTVVQDQGQILFMVKTLSLVSDWLLFPHMLTKKKGWRDGGRKRGERRKEKGDRRVERGSSGEELLIRH